MNKMLHLANKEKKKKDPFEEISRAEINLSTEPDKLSQ